MAKKKSKTGKNVTLQPNVQEKANHLSRQNGASHKGERINKWDPKNMEGALKEWDMQRGKENHERIGIRQISRAWMVPYATLRRRILSPRAEKVRHAHQSGRPTVLPSAAEAELASHIRNLAAAGFPLTRQEIRSLAYEYASANGITGFSENSKGAGYYWLDGFMKRHPELSIKKAENLSVARAMAMNKPQVLSWFKKFHDILTKLGIKDLPSHLWNTDETGCQNIHKADKVVGEVGIPTYNITALEKGETSTALVTINAIGQTPPPMVIHKGRKIGKNWTDGAKHGTLVRASKNGWINKELFLEHGQHFIKFLKDQNLDDGKPHLLVFDQHYSHLYNLDFLELMKANNVHVFALPSHTSHWIQPLDRGVFRSFKAAWQEQMRLFTRGTAGRKLEKKDFFLVFNVAWDRSMTVENAQGGFRGSGLFPYNPLAIPERAYAPSSTTDRPFMPVNTNDTDETAPFPPVPYTAAVLTPGPIIQTQQAIQTPQQALRSPQPDIPNPQPTPRAAVQTPQPSVQTPQPEARTPQPAVQTPQPAVQTPQPAVQTPQPAVQTPQPAVQTPQPAVQTPQPAVQTPQPEALTPQPEALTLQREALTPQPEALTPQPAAQTPQPAVQTPQPEVLTPQPAVQTPQPGVLIPQPAVQTPQPEVQTSQNPNLQPVASTSTSRTFSDLMPLPHRERNAPKKPREKPPSYELTSNETISFVARKLAKNPQPRKRSLKNKSSSSKVPTKAKRPKTSKQNAKQQSYPCVLCHYGYGDPSDPLFEDAWSRCAVCLRWGHDTCIVASGKVTNGNVKLCEDCAKKA